MSRSITIEDDGEQVGEEEQDEESDEEHSELSCCSFVTSQIQSKSQDAMVKGIGCGKLIRQGVMFLPRLLFVLPCRGKIHKRTSQVLGTSFLLKQMVIGSFLLMTEQVPVTPSFLQDLN